MPAAGEAIARVKEALQQGWCQNPTGLFIKSCKESLKPIKALVDNTITEWFNWTYKNCIVIAMTGGHTAFTPECLVLLLSLKQKFALLRQLDGIQKAKDLGVHFGRKKAFVSSTNY